MLRNIIKTILTLIGSLLGYILTDLIFKFEIIKFNSNILYYGLFVIIMIISGVIFYLLSPLILNRTERIIEGIEKAISSTPIEDTIIGFIGFISGIIIAFIITLPISNLSLPDVFKTLTGLITIIIYIIFASLGLRLASKNKEIILRSVNRWRFRNNENIKEKKFFKTQNKQKINVEELNNFSKVLDTSVIIDGRIKQIVETGFIDGDLIIPNFVLKELQTIADSSDEMKRERGRRGLDIVNEMQKNDKNNIIINDIDYKDIEEVDIKLLKLCSEIEASLMTNDYNLNKLAVVQGIKVLNINQLANSVKTVVIPGEKLIVNIIKEGREKKQGIAYFDDGTMIVVEDAKHLIGKDVEVVVTSVLQTSAGKMIFTKIENL